jgi:hypothetical protein
LSRGIAGRGIAGFRRWLAHWLRSLLPGSRPLCDTCRYDYGNVCKRPERPNALRCPDYRRK